LICLFIGLLLTYSAKAQTSINFRDDGPNCTTPGAPFQAERLTTTESLLQDGSTLIRNVHEILGRDNDGRFFAESYSSQAADKPGQHFYLIADPTAKRVLSWVGASKTATSSPLLATTHLQVSALPSDPSSETTQFPKDKTTVTMEDLGSGTIAGVLATGTRTVTVVAAGTNGNDQPLRSSQEIWIAKDLQIVVAETDFSPISGTRTVQIVSLTLTAPPSSLFELAVGLTVRERTAFPSGLPHLVPPPQFPDYWKALEEINDPDTQEKAATDLIAYARAHNDVANHVAHVLASHKIHLDDAESLARSSVERLEEQTASVTLDHATFTDLNRMNDLAEYWDTLGLVRWTAGDKQSARRYCQSAWELGGESLYMDHLARFAVQDGDTATALHMLRVAMSGNADEREKKQIANDYAKLSQENSQPKSEPAFINLTDPLPMQGKADFWLLFADNGPPQVKWAGGDDKLAVQGPAIASAKFQPQQPDSGPEHVLRRAHLECLETTCKLTFVYAYQAIPKLVPKPTVFGK
jgi:hypothetical protein